MSTSYLNIYGYKIKIHSSDFNTKQFKIFVDFSYFVCENQQSINLIVTVSQLSGYEKKGLYLGKTPMCEIRQLSFSERELIFRKNDLILAVVHDNGSHGKRQIDIRATDQYIIDDVLYFLINSCAGEFLDSVGLVRIHALAYTHQNKTGLICAASGMGKSTLALVLLKNPDVKIFSDEIVVFDLEKKFLLPYPIRISTLDFSEADKNIVKFNYFFNKKNLIPIQKDQIAQPCEITDIYFIDHAPKLKVFYYFSILLGLGLIQMREYLLRFNNPVILLRMLKNRIKLCFLLNHYRHTFIKKSSSISEKITAVL